jgi:predicted hydrolase (HD superfamily)
MNIIKFSNELTDDIFYEVVAQTMKDFELCGLEFSFSSTHPEEFLQTLLHHITKLNNYHPEQLAALLYRVDVKQEYISSIAEKFALSFEESITLCIAQREVEKIRFKKSHHSKF